MPLFSKILEARAFAMTRAIRLVLRTQSIMHVFLVRFQLIDCRTQLTPADVQRDLITTTSAISGFASCMFGLLTNLPVALA